MSRYCNQCGAPISDDQKFCNYCGAKNEAEIPQTPVYTAPEQQTPNYTPYEQPAPLAQADEMPMKWYKFVIFFQLFAACVVGVLTGISMMTGSHYVSAGGDPDLIYRLLPDLKGADMFYGLASIVIGIYAIYVRTQLKNFKKSGPTQYYVFLIANTVASLIYLIMLENAISGTLTGKYIDMDSISSQYYSSIAGNLVVLALNISYFKKRAHLFEN